MLNHFVGMGRLVRDPDMRRTDKGVSVANFTIAVERDFKQNGEKEVDYIECVAWRQSADFVCKYLGKGRMVAVSGRLQSRKWTDKNGNNRTNWEIQVDNAYPADSKRDREEGGSTYAPTAETAGAYDKVLDYAAEMQKKDFNYPFPGQQQEFAVLEDDDGQLPF